MPAYSDRECRTALEEADLDAARALAVLEDASEAVWGVICLARGDDPDEGSAAMCWYACRNDLRHAHLLVETVLVLVGKIKEQTEMGAA